MKQTKLIQKCPNCGRGVYGFWKWGPNYVCSKMCFRRLIAERKIEPLNPMTANAELGTLSKRNT